MDEIHQVNRFPLCRGLVDCIPPCQGGVYVSQFVIVDDCKKLPHQSIKIIRCIYLKAQPFLCLWVGDREAAGVEAQAWAGAAVAGVADDGVTEPGEVGADLMLPARFDSDLKKTAFLGVLFCCEMGDGLFGGWVGTDVHSVFDRVLPEGLIDGSLIGIGMTFHNGEINLLRFAPKLRDGFTHLK